MSHELVGLFVGSETGKYYGFVDPEDDAALDQDIWMHQMTNITTDVGEDVHLIKVRGSDFAQVLNGPPILLQAFIEAKRHQDHVNHACAISGCKRKHIEYDV
jgi:hypothetical protein